MHSQFLNARAPIPVSVSSRQSRSEPFLLSVRMVRRISRLAREVWSICRNFLRFILFMDEMWPSVVFCVSFRYSMIAPAGGMRPSSPSSMPKPSRVTVPKCFKSRCFAWYGSKYQAGRCVTMAPVSCVTSLASFPVSASNSSPRLSGRRHSAGDSRKSSSSIFFSGNCWTKKWPVETSTQLIAAVLFVPKLTAQRKLSSLAFRSISSVSVPGVTIRTTSRLTTPFAVFGSSTCSQTATL
ncbi:hypothetical protein ES703_96740 [subsurface metagenome]